MNATEWETAWNDYIAALEQFDRTFPNRHKRGQTREHNHSKTALGAARKRLEAIDPTFCERAAV